MNDTIILSKFYNGKPLSIYDIFHSCRYVVLRLYEPGQEQAMGHIDPLTISNQELNVYKQYTLEQFTDYVIEDFQPAYSQSYPSTTDLGGNSEYIRITYSDTSTNGSIKY